jgi:hypothetical protein
MGFQIAASGAALLPVSEAGSVPRGVAVRGRWAGSVVHPMSLPLFARAVNPLVEIAHSVIAGREGSAILLRPSGDKRKREAHTTDAASG